MTGIQDRTNLSRLSRPMARLSAIGAVAVPLAAMATFFLGDIATGGGFSDAYRSSSGFGFAYREMSAIRIAETPFAFRIAAFVLVLVPTGFTVWALVSLRKLFFVYAAGEVFSREALRLLNHVAAALFASVIADIVMQPPVMFILSWFRGAGHRYLSLGIGSADIAALFIAGAVLVIARVMAEARRMADENASFV